MGCGACTVNDLILQIYCNTINYRDLFFVVLHEADNENRLVLLVSFVRDIY